MRQDWYHKPPPSTEHEVLTLYEAMQYLRSSRSTVLRLMQRGELQGHKLGGTWRFYRADLDRAITRPGLDEWHPTPPVTEVPVTMIATYEGQGKPRPFHDPFDSGE